MSVIGRVESLWRFPVWSSRSSVVNPRCKIITLDPDTGEASPELLRVVVRNDPSNAGVYGAVLAEGTVRPGDPIELLD